MKRRRSFCFLVFFLFIFGFCVPGVAAGLSNSGRIRTFKKNPHYWQYKGKPVVLIGGSVEDNLFQVKGLKKQLDILRRCGGNYVRCTMSDRDEGDVKPFKKLSSGKYDLNQWNPEYWNRFTRFLELSRDRDIIAQIEIWATFDYYRDLWALNPFNPKNNINYTAKETGLPLVVKTHPTRTGNNFFWSVPSERNQKKVLKYQERFVDKILSISLPFGNVLYCMDNETSVTPEWGKFWSQYIKAKAEALGVSVETTEMWDPWDLSNKMHNATFDHPEVYSFVDISQNNHQKGQHHWDNAQRQRQRIAKHVRPLNNVKIYGADTGRFGKSQDGLERFWRNIFGGLASARFHRPDSGLGLSSIAQVHLKSMSKFLSRFDIFKSVPDSNSRLLSDRSTNEAYLTYVPGKQFAVYFPARGSVILDLSREKGMFTLSWLDISKSAWEKTSSVKGGKRIKLSTPGPGHWVVLLSQS